MSTLPPILDYPAIPKEPSPIFAKTTFFIALLPIFAILFAFFDPLPGTSRGEPVAGIACILAFLSAPLNLIAAIGFSFLYRDYTGPRSICVAAAFISGLATLLSSVMAFVFLFLGPRC